MTAPFLANSTCSNFVSQFFAWGHPLVGAGTLIMKSALMVREFLIYHFSLNTAATPFNNCNLTRQMTHTFNYIIIIGGLNVGDFVQ